MTETEKIINAQQSTDDDKLYDKITKMTNDELKDAINTPIDIEAAEVSTELDEPEETENPNKFLLELMESEDILKLYDLAIKAKNNPKFNVVAELPKSIYDLIINTIYKDKSMGIIPKKDLSKFVRMLIINLGEEISKDNEFKTIKDDIDTVIKEGQIEFINAYEEYTKELFGDTLKERANKEENPELKKKLLDLSTAYEDSYQLKKQKDLLKDPIFMNRLIKNENKRFDRLCDNFDFILNKKFLHKVSIRDLFKLLPKVLKVNELQIKDYIIATCIATKDVATDDAAGLMYMYNSINIIKLLIQSASIPDEEKAEFIINSFKNLKEFFAKLQYAKENQTINQNI